MSEYIKRQDAIKAVDGAVSSENVCDNINAIPAADVEPVVRCKDCRFFDVCLVRQLANIADVGFCSLGDKAHMERSGSGE